MNIRSSDAATVTAFAKKMKLPAPDSHKGQNGRLLVIGGSSLFHSPSLWAAEVASHFVDIVHYSSTEENQHIFQELKTRFLNGIIVHQKDLPFYIREDDAVLVGPGMVRADKGVETKESDYTKDLTRKLLTGYHEKRLVLDAGALQMMEREWLLKRTVPAILTPHQLEFATLFDIELLDKSLDDKEKIVLETAKKYKCVIHLKAVADIISDGVQVYRVEGGNAGLTKGGTGDVLAALIASLYAKNDAIDSCILGSYIVKSAGDRLFKGDGYWYNIDDLIKIIPAIVTELALTG